MTEKTELYCQFCGEDIGDDGPGHKRGCPTDNGPRVTEKTESRDDLAPCPFCGCDAQLYEDGDRDWEAFCNGDDCSAQTGRVPTKEIAIAAWNRRSPTPAGREKLVEALRPFADAVEPIRPDDKNCAYGYFVNPVDARHFFLARILLSSHSPPGK